VPAGDFPHLAYTLRVGRTHRAVRGAVLAEDPATAAAALADPDRVLRADGESRSVVFAFPGQGAQLPGMYHDLYDGEPLFRRGCDAAFDVLAPLLGQDLRAVWRQADDPQRLAPTEVVQPLLYVLETTLAHCLLHWGVTPEVLIGHSVGELVAAAVAGVFDFEAGLRAVAARARCLREMPPGRMLAVPAGEAELAGLLPDTVVVAAVNAPDRLVVAGTAEAIDEVAAALRDRGRTGRILNTSHAFHSPVMADAVPAFAAALRELPLNPPAIPVISAATGAVLTAEQACSPTFWAEQIGQPVRFDRAAQALFAGGPATVLEVGPGHTLTRLLRAREDARTTRSRVHATTSRDGRASTVDEVLARLWVDGAAVDFARVDQGRGYRRVAAPGYPYQRRRFWLEPAAAEPPAEAPPAPAAAPQSRPAADAAPAPAQPTPPVAGAAPAPSGAAWRLAELDWVRDRDPLPPPAPGPATGAAVLLAPRDPAVARQVVTGLQRAGYRTVRAVPGGEFDPTGPAGWQRLLDSAAGRGTNGLVLAHAGLLEAPYQVGRDSLEEQLGAGLDAVHGAIQAAAAIHRQHRLPVRLVILGRGLVNVTGSEPVNPASASVIGLLRTAEREVAGLTGQVVDVAGEIDADQLASVLAGPALPVVALRGGCRWLPRLATLRDADQPPRLRSKGTYLITGGLGGIGLVIARTLAETGLCPRIALLGRTGPDGRDPAARDLLERTLAGLVEAGAQVETFAVDVAEVPALDRVVSTVEDRFGTVHGVVHAAGLAGGGLVERRDRADMRAVLRPKAAGILAIEEVFARRPALDFLALFSSQAGLAGLYGSADYAAANAFLDAYASRPGPAARRTLSVQWPGWAEVGMLAGSPTAAKVLGGQGAPDGGTRVNGGGPRDHAAERTVLEVIRTPGEDWEFDEHLFRDVPVLPGTALVELAVLAARATGVPAAGWPIELRDMVFFTPVVGDTARRVRVVVGELAGVHRFRIQSCRVAGGGRWTDHATGTFRPGKAVAPPDPVHLAERLATETEFSLAGWMHFGPRWSSTVATSGHATEALARLVLPERFRGDFADHPVHPALLDVAAGVLTDVEPGHEYAPFMYRRITVVQPLTADVTVHAWFLESTGRGRRPVSFDIIDTASHTLLLRAESFVTREVLDGFDPTEEPEPHANGARATSPRPAVPAPRPDLDGAPAWLLRPEDGAAAFLDSLCPGRPPVVLVDLPARPLEVPGIPWTDPPRGHPQPVHSGPQEPAPTIPAPAAAPDRDRVEAPAVAAVPAVVASPAVAPGADDDEVLNELRRLWGDALGLTELGVDDDFFELGGDSLGAVQVAARISARFGVEVSAGSLFDTPTLRTLTAEVHSLTGALPVGGAR
jgi:acyl transferase domain-containing protein/acyl carrier protein